MARHLHHAKHKRRRRVRLGKGSDKAEDARHPDKKSTHVSHSRRRKF